MRTHTPITGEKTGPDPHGGYLLPGSFGENSSAFT